LYFTLSASKSPCLLERCPLCIQGLFGADKLNYVGEDGPKIAV
jgi:hypothetical protein